MVKRKGEVTPGAILRDFPWRVVFPESEVGADHMRGAGFYPSHGPRPVTRTRKGTREVLICFGKRGDAEAFQRHAGGVLEGG